MEILVPGQATLAQLGSDLARGAARASGPRGAPRRRGGRRPRGRGRGRHGAGLWREHGLRQAREPQDRSGRYGATATQPDPVALLRRGRAYAPVHGAADDCAEAPVARPRRLGRALGDRGAARRHAGRGRHAGDPGAGVGRRERRSGTPRPYGRGHDRRGRGRGRRQAPARCRGAGRGRSCPGGPRTQGRARPHQRHAILDRLCPRRPLRGLARRSGGPGDLGPLHRCDHGLDCAAPPRDPRAARPCGPDRGGRHHARPARRLGHPREPP